MPRTLLIAHGMGIYNKPEWSTEIAAILDELAGGYDGLGDKTFSEQVNIVPIAYDSVFANAQQSVGDSAQAVEAYAQAHPGKVDGSLLSLTGWLKDAASDEFVWSHVADVIMYRFFPDIVAEIHARVLKQITAAVVQAREDAVTAGGAASISIMCHSLGTSVIRDALHRLGSEVYTSEDSSTSQYLASKGRLLNNIFMVANVGRVLQTRWKVHRDTCVRPASSGPGEYCQLYYNFRHRLDPFTAICPFIPQGWGEGYTALENLSHIRAINVHGWDHYLRDPDVHVPFFRAMFSSGDIIDDDTYENAREEYKASPSTVCSTAAAELETELTALSAGDPACTPRRILETAVGYFKTVIKAARSCGLQLKDLSV